MTDRPKLSVLLRVPVPWPEYEPNLVELRRQVSEIDAEPLLLDGSPDGSAAPPDGEAPRTGMMHSVSGPRAGTPAS